MKNHSAEETKRLRILFIGGIHEFAAVKKTFETGGMKTDFRYFDCADSAMDYLLRREPFENLSISPPPDLIMLRLNLPGKDGTEALKEIKADPALRGIPVALLLSAKHEGVCRHTGYFERSFALQPIELGEMIEELDSLTAYWFKIVRCDAREEFLPEETPSPSDEGEEFRSPRSGQAPRLYGHASIPGKKRRFEPCY